MGTMFSSDIAHAVSPGWFKSTRPDSSEPVREAVFQAEHQAAVKLLSG
jgi:hypothetical protein